MIESSVVFGEHKHLLGTLTQPALHETAPARIGCVLMCAGIIHRIGPHRINVKLARAFSDIGLPSVRMDLAAVGDSRPPPTDTAYDEQAVTDLRATIDLLEQRTQVTHVLMAGLCSGAIYSFMTALKDERVTGLYMIDGYAYPTPRSKRERYRQRARQLSPSGLARSLRARLGKQEHPSAPPGQAAPDYGLSHPPIDDTASRLNHLLDRGVSVAQLFSGSILQHYNYDNQFAEAFGAYPGIDRIQTEYAPHIDHTMTSIAAQREMIDKITAWASGVSGASAKVGAA